MPGLFLAFPLILAACAAREASVKVSLGGLVTDKPADAVAFDLDGVQAEVVRNVGHLEQCYQQRFDQVPDLQGSVTIHANITPAGVVDEQCIGEDRIGDPAIVQCVNELIAMGSYPTGHTQSVDVTFPFRFSPTDRAAPRRR